jgi:hypothetical protein
MVGFELGDTHSVEKLRCDHAVHGQTIHSHAVARSGAARTAL